MPETNTKVNFNNPDERKQYYQAYYKKNRDSLLAKGKEKIICGTCGKSVCKAHFAKHLESKVHQMAMKGLTIWGTPLVKSN